MITTCMRAGRNLRTLAIVIIMAAAGLITSASAQSLRTVSYQGLLKSGSTMMNGSVSLTISYYYVGASSPILTETFPEVSVTDGAFGIMLGSHLGGFPETVDFSQPIEIGVSVNGGTELPRSLLTAVPYALAAHTLDGIPVSATPQNNHIFPIPLDAEGHISSTLLHPTPTVSINGVSAVNNNLRLSAGQNVTLTPDYANNQLVISTAVGSVTSVTVGQGMIGGGNNGAISVGLNPGQVPGNWLSPGSVTGHQLNSTIAGPGLTTDGNGNFGLSVDPANFTLTSDMLHLRQDVPVVGTSGTFGMLTATDNVMLGNGEGSTVTVDGPLYVRGPLDAGFERIYHVGTPVDNWDATTKIYVDSVRTHLAYGNILVGNESGLAQGREMYGDAWINGDGNITVNGLQGIFVEGSTPSDGDLLTYVSGEAGAWAPRTLTLSGDITGGVHSTYVHSLQGIPLSASEPANNALLRYNSEGNQWEPADLTIGQVNEVVAGTGITVNNSNPQDPIVSVTPLTETGAAGSVSLVASGGFFGQSLVSQTVNNSLVGPNSIIMLTVVMDGNSSTSRHYLPFVSDIASGSFTINLHEASSNLNNGEGCTIHYVIFN